MSGSRLPSSRRLECVPPPPGPACPGRSHKLSAPLPWAWRPTAPLLPRPRLGPASSATAQAPSRARRLASRRGPLTPRGRWGAVFQSVNKHHGGLPRACPAVRLTRSVTHRTRCVTEGGCSEVGCAVRGGDMEQGRSVWEGGRAAEAACAKALKWEGAGGSRGRGGAGATVASMQWG